MKYRIYLFIIPASMLLSWACTKKITNEYVNVLAPANNAVTTNNSITFWWDLLDGADSYNLQIVQPSFAAAQTLIADTTVTTNKLLLSLTPGIYQWRIKGINGGGNTKYNTFNLVVDTSSNLSSQLVVVIGPANNFVTASSSITFSWNPIVSATQYEIIINSTPAVDVTSPNTTYTGTFTAGTYSWQVKALNGFSLSQYNVARTFRIDQTAPSAPGNLAISSAIVASSKVTDTLTWHRNSTDVKYDSLYFYTDAGLVSLGYSGPSPNPKIDVGHFLPVPTGTPTVPYWWRIKSIDSVGNASFFSAVAAFTLTP